MPLSPNHIAYLLNIQMKTLHFNPIFNQIPNQMLCDVSAQYHVFILNFSQTPINLSLKPKHLIIHAPFRSSTKPASAAQSCFEAFQMR